MGGSVGAGVGESGGWVDGPRKSWWLFVGISPRNMPGCVGGLVGGCGRSVYTMPEVRYTDCAWYHALVDGRVGC